MNPTYNENINKKKSGNIMMENDKPAQVYTIKKFGALFVFFCATFYAITELTPSTFAQLNNYSAAMMGFSLRVLGIQPTVHGVFVSAGGFGAEIITECSAIYMLILFSSFVLAYPTTLKNKAIGLLFGIPFLFAVNTLRLVLGFIAGMWRPDLFEYIHVYLWQTIIIILVFVTCLTWLHYMVMVTTRNEPLAFLMRFVAFSSIPFLIWIYLDKIYMSLNSYITEVLLSGVGYPVHLAPDPNVTLYPSTFNLIAFTALILATQTPMHQQKIRKIKALAIGLTLMMLVEVVHGSFQILAELGVDHASEIKYAAVIANQYFLPFGLWLAFTYKDVFRRAGTYICPICGEEKVGIVEHMRVKHGENALEDKRVKAVLRRGAFREKMRLDFVVGAILRKRKE